MVHLPSADFSSRDIDAALAASLGSPSDESCCFSCARAVWECVKEIFEALYNGILFLLCGPDDLFAARGAFVGASPAVEAQFLSAMSVEERAMHAWIINPANQNTTNEDEQI